MIRRLKNSAYECKHRPLTLDDVKHGIRKGKKAGTSEYCFVIAAGIEDGHDSEIRAEISGDCAQLDLEVLDIRKVTKAWAIALNPKRRGVFGQTVTTILRDEMHRTEVANKAAELWNNLEQASG